MTTTFALPKMPDQKEAQAMVKTITTQALGFKIEDEDGFVASWALVERHDAAIAKIGEWFDPFVDGLHKMHKMAINLRNTFLDPVTASKRLLLGERHRYRIEKERLKKIEDDKAAEAL